MTGGIRRLATYVRQSAEPSNTLLIEAGPLSGGHDRQDALKLETSTAILADLKFDAILWTSKDAQLGPGALLTANQLAPDLILNSHLDETDYGTRPYVISKGFRVIGLNRSPRKLQFQGHTLPVENPDVLNQLSDRLTIALTDYNLDQARSLARNSPALKLVVYQVDGTAPEPETVGGTLLVSPGSYGRSILKLNWESGKFVSQTEIKLEAQYKDDPAANRLYQVYLTRLQRESLLAKVPKTSDEKFIGSKACAKCHGVATRIYEKSNHAVAFGTLEKERHNNDPDCVSCHVTGFDSTKGFVSRAITPRLAAVGCESCHGGGKLHVSSPKKIKMPKKARAACISCHTPENSPGFNFLTFWPKIQHR